MKINTSLLPSPLRYLLPDSLIFYFAASIPCWIKSTQSWRAEVSRVCSLWAQALWACGSEVPLWIWEAIEASPACWNGCWKSTPVRSCSDSAAVCLSPHVIVHSGLPALQVPALNSVSQGLPSGRHDLPLRCLSVGTCASERFLLNHVWNWQVSLTLVFLWRQFGSISAPNYKGHKTIGSTLCFQKGKIELYKQLVSGRKFYKIQYYDFSKRSFSNILV